MSKLRYVSTKKKIFITTCEIIGYISCIIAIVLKFTAFSSAAYIILGITLPCLSLICSYFPIFDSYVDKVADTSIYVLTATDVLLVALFITTAFIAR